MATTYLFNGSAIVTPFTIVSNEPHFDMTTVSLKTQRSSQGHQRWELAFSTVNTDTTEVDALLGAIQNFDQAQTMIMPQLPSCQGDHFNTDPNVYQSYTAGTTTVRISKGGTTGKLPKGSFVTFSNHDKLYITTNELDLTTLAAADVGIYPALKTSVTSSHTLQTASNCLLTYYMDIDNAMGVTFSDGILSNTGTISLVEAV